VKFGGCNISNMTIVIVVSMKINIFILAS